MLAQLEGWLAAKETERLELKEAKTSFDRTKLERYCIALANEGGGSLLLGVTNDVPRRVVGTAAFGDLEKLKLELLNAVRLRIEVAQVAHPDGRVVVFTIPPRPIGMPLALDGAYWMRAGESLTAMTPDQLKRIFDEGVPDFTASICNGATLADLDAAAIARFRELCARRRRSVDGESDAQLLENAELTVDGAITYAALVLLGSRRALGRHLAQAEIIFEYRANENDIAYADREEIRDAFLLVDDRVWALIARRNTIAYLVEGTVRREIPAFNERALREAVLNAICHRDYRLQGSVFVKQSPQTLQIASPGGFPTGITAANIMYRQSPRNRRLAEAFGRCGLVERSGQGADLLFATAVQEGKVPLDYAGSDAFQVQLSLHGQIRDEAFVRFLNELRSTGQDAPSTLDLVALDAVRREQDVPESARTAVPSLIDRGVLERAGKRRLVIAQRFHRLMGSAGAHTRKKGLDRETQKALLVDHVRRYPGSGLADFCDVLPNLSEGQVRRLIRDLQTSGLLRVEGKTRGARWFLV